MNSEGRRFPVSVTFPDWGQDHLSPEAVVAYVDEELADGPSVRATRHIGSCPECSQQVMTQMQARSELRSAACPSLPSSLMSSLCSIPEHTELPGAPAGLAVTADGQFVSVLRPTPEQPPAPPTTPPPTTSRRMMRMGAGAAMSGIALGALALGAGAMAGDSAVPPAAAGPGAWGGSVLGSRPAVDAELRIVPASRADTVGPLHRTPGSFFRLP